jgi:hypothetical protein
MSDLGARLVAGGHSGALVAPRSAVVTFPNAAAVVIARLRVAIPTLVIVHDVPSPRPSVFARIFRTGGPRANLVVDAAHLTVESWAPGGDLAATNAELVRAHLNALQYQFGVTPAIYLVEEMSGPAELPDPVSSSRRFTWTAVVHIRGN